MRPLRHATARIRLPAQLRLITVVVVAGWALMPLMPLVALALTWFGLP